MNFVDNHLYQLFVEGGRGEIVDQGALPSELESLRTVADKFSAKFRADAAMAKRPHYARLTAALGGREGDLAVLANADALQKQIEQYEE